MGIYKNYISPGVKYLTYITFLISIVMLAFQLRKIYQSNCRIMLFDALGKPFIPGMIFLILFFWKNINEFVMKSELVGGKKDEETPEPVKEETHEPVKEEETPEPVKED